jgi:hypothetical protein
MHIITILITIMLSCTGTVYAFTDNGDGTVTDSRTGLMWQKQDDGGFRNWDTALTYCEGLTLASHSDWRLPNIKALRSIVDNTKTNPAIDSTYFPQSNSGEDYWSSTSAGDTNAWIVSFSDGSAHVLSAQLVGANYKNFLKLVRCARGGQ